MWRRGDRRCVLLVANGQFNLHIVEGETIVQQLCARSADSAVTLAAIWEETYASPDQARGEFQHV
jgi:hypothetical protein